MIWSRDNLRISAIRAYREHEHIAASLELHRIKVSVTSFAKPEGVGNCKTRSMRG